jgi:hypothetical protein
MKRSYPFLLTAVLFLAVAGCVPAFNKSPRSDMNTGGNGKTKSTTAREFIGDGSGMTGTTASKIPGSTFVPTNTGTSWGQTLHNPTTVVTQPQAAFGLSRVIQNASFFMAPGVPLKAIYYVAAKGSDTNSGLSPSAPLASLSWASHFVATNSGSLIWCLPGTNLNEINGTATQTNITLYNGVSVYFDNCNYFQSNRYNGNALSFFRPASNNRIRFSPMNGAPSTNNATSGLFFVSSQSDHSVSFGIGSADQAMVSAFTNVWVDDMYMCTYAAGPHIEATAGGICVPIGIIFNNPYIVASSGDVEIEGETNQFVNVVFNNGIFIAQPTGSAAQVGFKPRRCVEVAVGMTNYTSQIPIHFFGCTFAYSDSDNRQTCGVYLNNGITNQAFLAGCTFTNKLVHQSATFSADLLNGSGTIPFTNVLVFDSSTSRSDGHAFIQTNAPAVGGGNTIYTNINQPLLVFPP